MGVGPIALQTPDYPSRLLHGRREGFVVSTLPRTLKTLEEDAQPTVPELGDSSRKRRCLPQRNAGLTREPEESGSSPRSAHTGRSERTGSLAEDEVRENQLLCLIGVARACRRLEAGEEPSPVVDNEEELMQRRRARFLPISEWDEVLHGVPEVVFLGPPIICTHKGSPSNQSDEGCQ